MLRAIKILLITAVCLWGAMSALGNLIDWQGTRGAVGAVSGMTGLDDGLKDWRAISNTWVILAGAACIVTFKILSAMLCGLGAYRMLSSIDASNEHFGAAKHLALAGCGVAVFGLFLGWIVLGEQWFEMWRSPQLGMAGEAAFRYGGFIGIIGVFVAMPEN